MQDATGNRISRQELLWSLQCAAQVRSLVTMLSSVALLIAAAVFGESLGPGGMAVVFFGGSQFVMVFLTRFYCRRAVRCPHCGNSLWPCGTGNFKPRRMRIRSDAQQCSYCHAMFV